MIANRIAFITLLAAGLCAWSGSAMAQQNIKGKLRLADSTFVQIVKTIDGSSNVGSIVQIDSVNIVLQTSVTAMTIPVAKITEIKDIQAGLIRKGEYWFVNPNATRLFFGPTAHMLNKGEGYFSDTYLFFPQIVYGFTGNLTLGGGMSLLPGAGLGKQLLYLLPKAGGPVGHNLHLAAGALVIKLPDFDDENNAEDITMVGVLYGVGTRGSRDRSFTAGLGYGFEGDKLADRPMVMLGGEYRVSRRISLVTENWMFPGLDQPLVSAGFRFFGEGLAVDLALANVLGEDMLFPGIPFVDFVYNF